MVKLLRMSTSYNRVAGQSVERLAALSDGIFGVAMTLLLLELHVPERKSVASEHDLWRALLAMSPQLLVYLMSFITLGIFWVGQQTQANHLARCERHLTWLHLAFLFGVTLLPFSTRLLAEFIVFRVALLAYWLNILLLGAMLYFTWLRHPGAFGEGGNITRSAGRDLPANPDRPGALRICGAAVRYQHLRQHRIHRVGAAQLRGGATALGPKMSWPVAGK